MQPSDSQGQVSLVCPWLALEPIEHHHSCVQDTVDGLWAVLQGHLEADIVTDLQRVQVVQQVRLSHSLEPMTMPQKEGNIVLMLLVGACCHVATWSVQLDGIGAPSQQLAELHMERMHLSQFWLGGKQSI